MSVQEHHKIFEQMEDNIQHSNADEETKTRLLRNLLNLKNQKLNIMITGPTGAGKSSTINAIFNMEVAKVGVGVDPETEVITEYKLGNMSLWDTPGLGDGKENDDRHAKAIIKKLNEIDDNGEPLIDLVLVILDGSIRDLGTSYKLINTIIIPNLGKEAEKRLLVAINQADMAMKGKDRWDYDNNKPTPKAEKFLEEKVQSVKTRIKEATGVNIEPIYYCAGYKEEGEEQRPYNLSKLLYLIVKHIPSEKRLLIVDNISKNQEMWKNNDELKNYTTEIRSSFGVETVLGGFVDSFETVLDDVLDGVDTVLDGVLEGVETVVEGVETVVDSVVDGVETVVDGVKDFFSSWF